MIDELRPAGIADEIDKARSLIVQVAQIARPDAEAVSDTLLSIASTIGTINQRLRLLDAVATGEAMPPARHTADFAPQPERHQ